MRFPFMVDESEWFTKFCMKLIWVISHYWKATALQRAIFCESGDNDMAAWLDRSKNRLYICMTLISCS